MKVTLETQAVSAAIALLHDIEPFTFSWSGVSPALDDCVIAAVDGLESEVSDAAVDAYRSVGELLAGGQAALATLVSAEQEMVGALDVLSEKVGPAYEGVG